MKKIVLLFIGLCIIPLWAKPSLKYKVQLKGYFDSNIGQNITEESSFYGTPSLGMALSVPVKKIAFLMGGSVTYENYLQKRLATLNSPFLYPYAGIRIKTKKFSSSFKAKYAAYYSHTFVVAKTSYRLTLENNFRLKKGLYLTLDGGVMYNDYATNSSDGYRYTTALSVKKSWRKKVISKVEPFFEGEFNKAKSDTASYDQLEAGIATDFDFNIFQAGISASLKRKEYGASYEHPHTNLLFTPINKYAVFSLAISKEVIKGLKISLTGKNRFKSSTNPTMDYDRHTITLSLLWSDFIIKE